MPHRTPLVVVLLSALLLAPLLSAADTLDELRQKLARESDPDDRAKITVKIGEKLLKKIGKAFKKGAVDDGEKLLVDYLEAIHKSYDELKESGRDARRKPKGFKDLEIHLRRSHRELQELGNILTFEERGPINEAMADLETLRHDLLQNLMSRDGQSD